jgi:hypothetical protein
MTSAETTTTNKLNRDTNNFMRNVHGLLRKNRRILADLYWTESTKSTRMHFLPWVIISVSSPH